VLKVFKVLQDLEVLQDQVDQQAPQEVLVLKVFKVLQDPQDQVAPQDQQDLREHLLQQSIMEVKVLLPALVPVLLLIHHGKMLVVYLFLTFIFQLL
jgi:hypothetical protein